MAGNQKIYINKQVIIFCDFYFRDSKEPRETRVIKGSQKLGNLQYQVVVLLSESSHHFTY